VTCLTHGVQIRPLTTHADARGSVVELFDPRWRWHPRAVIDGPEFALSGWHYPPNGASFVRSLDEFRCNVVAAECKYIAVPWEFGPVEPCMLGNHPNLSSGWTEVELLNQLETAACHASSPVRGVVA
jgi:hypothetical protein